jgi:hypothetical protein
MPKSKGKDLVAIIKANPGCVAIVDDYSWTLYSLDPNELPDDVDAERYELASDRDVAPLGDGGYGSGSNYGGDILQALAKIVGVKIESV